MCYRECFSCVHAIDSHIKESEHGCPLYTRECWNLDGFPSYERLDQEALVERIIEWRIKKGVVLVDV